MYVDLSHATCHFTVGIVSLGLQKGNDYSITSLPFIGEQALLHRTLDNTESAYILKESLFIPCPPKAVVDTMNSSSTTDGSQPRTSLKQDGDGRADILNGSSRSSYMRRVELDVNDDVGGVDPRRVESKYGEDMSLDYFHLDEPSAFPHMPIRLHRPNPRKLQTLAEALKEDTPLVICMKCARNITSAPDRASLVAEPPERQLYPIHPSASSWASSSKISEGTTSTTLDEPLPPTDWSLYRTLFSDSPDSPYTQYHALVALGYDGAFETFLKVHPNREHLKLANRVLGKSIHSPEVRAKLAMRPMEDVYIAHMKDRLNNPENGKDGKPGFVGGSFAQWQKWIDDLRDSGLDLPAGLKKNSSRDSTKPNWGIHTLLPPSAKEPSYRFFTLSRRNDQSRQACLVRSVRLSSQSPAHGPLRVNLDISGWPVGVSITFCMWFDKEKNVLRFTDKEGKDVARSMTVKDMIMAGEIRALLDLGITQGLINRDEARAGEARWNLQFACDTLDLGTHLARGAAIQTYRDHVKVSSRRRWRWTLKDPEQCLKSPGPEAEESYIPGDGPSKTNQGDSPLSEPTTPASDLRVDAEQTQVVVPRVRKGDRPAGGDRDFYIQLSIADDALFRPKQGPGGTGVWIEEQVEMIPYITCRGSITHPTSVPPRTTASPVADGAESRSYLIDVVTPLSWPPSRQDPIAQSEATTSKKFVASQSPHSLRFFLPQAHLRRDVLLFARRNSRGSKAVVGVAYTGEEVRSRWPMLFEWGKARGWWPEIEPLETTSEPLLEEPESEGLGNVPKGAAGRPGQPRTAESDSVDEEGPGLGRA
ncbi:hypothetical protein FRB97_003767 [Tulasnella sp. 331]|nr:hypothetical protein FRB97_003767 [Tulasnella sp. 331]